MRVLKAFAVATALLTSNVVSLPNRVSKVDNSARNLIVSRNTATDPIAVVQSAITTFEQAVTANHAEIENEVDDAEKNPFHVEDTSSHDSLMSHLQHIADAASAAGHKIEDALAKAPKKMTDTEAKNLKAHALKLDPITQKIKDALDKALHSPALNDSGKMTKKKSNILEGLEKMVRPLKNFLDHIPLLGSNEPTAALKSIVDEIIAKIKASLAGS